jgi:hypothetical protein
MRNQRIASAILRIAALAVSPVLLAQAAAPQSQAGKAPTNDHVDLSGDWGYAIGINYVPEGGDAKLGPPADKVPYQPWARDKFLSERPMTGPRATFANTTDPHMVYCDPLGTPRIWTWPSKYRFIQTPEAVYIIYEYDMSWRVVWLNRKHTDDPDPTWWGESVGKYEGNDTLVIDTIGFNGKTWLDMAGRPQTDKAHLIERIRRVDSDNLEITLTIDDPGAYTATWTYGPKIVKNLKLGFAKAQWICEVRENQYFDDTVEKPTVPETPSK